MSTTVSDTSELGVAPELSAFQRQILAVLAEEARYGLAIKRELEAYYDQEINHGRLYPNLDDLVELGLVEKSARDRRTNEYALTEAGCDTITTQLSWVFSRFVTDEDRATELETLVDDAR
ncbi:PadR family transcriptional regulator [Halocatena marina]|uniref:PadR family transcriptional regulator n=1 Tax=Halocatena marina TaxID=2934937 RepID=UPI002225723D|nr:PadR family transcriptional regulator [Halocatena marina]